jgi:hypothetical protein
MIASVRMALGLVCVATAVVAAQPAPDKKPSADKKTASELYDDGNKQFEAGKYIQALAFFKEAYSLLPNPKIQLNIAVTLNKLNRIADAANAFQHYIDLPDADPSMKPEIEKALVDMDKKLGTLEITVTPPDAEVQINLGEWLPAAEVKLYRISEGKFEVRARKEGYTPDTKSAQIRAGEKAAVPIALALVPVKTKEVIKIVPGGIVGQVQPEGPRARLGAFALEHLDIPHSGAATFVGITFDVIDRLQIQGAAIVGGTYGGYVGVAFAVLPGKFRPIVVAGMPIFMSDGARYGVRGAGGFELQVNRHLALIAELGVEHTFNPNVTEDTLFIPAIGASGRL